MSDIPDEIVQEIDDLDELRRLRGAGLFVLTVQYLGGGPDSDSEHQFWAFSVPRVGEIISPKPGRYTRVEGVMYRPIAIPKMPPGQKHALIPYVMVRDVAPPGGK